jgi:hypothetical protein
MTPDNGVEVQSKAAPVEQQVQVQIHPAQQVVQISTRTSRFDITPHETFIPFAMLDVIYLQVLTVRLQANGQLPPPQPGIKV